MTLDATEGVRSASGSVVATLADPAELELEISVAEADIPNVSLGQVAAIEVDALPGKTFDGVVSAISPINDSSSSSVSYPVTVRLTSTGLTGVRPGMNAVATLQNNTTLAPNSWLVPTNALRTNGAETVVMVMRDGQPSPVSVTTGAVQGEWTTVQSAELQPGDEVMGSITSNTNQQNGFFGGPPPDMGGGMAGGPRN
jgi:multidrug efflux pump subunit AcrA (membrane-fusion protein)